MLFDSYHDNFSILQNVKKDKLLVFSKNSKAIVNLDATGGISLDIYGKNINGDGKFDVVVYYEDSSETFNCRFASTNIFKKSIVVSADCYSKIRKISISKRYNSIGRITISRLIVSESKNKNFKSYIPKINIGIIVPYSIYGGGEVYLKDLVSSTVFEKEYAFHFMYFKENKLSKKINKKNVVHINLKNDTHLEDYIIKNNLKSVIFYNSINIYKKLKLLQLKNNFRIFEIYHSDFMWADSMCKVKNHDVDCMIKISPCVGSHIITKNIKICKVPIDLEKFYKINKSKSKSIFNIKNNKNIGVISRISKEKNLDYILSLSKEMPDFLFHIVGDGPGRLSLEKKINNEKINNIKLTGWINDVSKILCAFDAVVLPSKKEGTPISILESMSVDIPSFCYPSGGIPDLIKNGAYELYLNPKIDSERIKMSINKGVNTRDYIYRNHCIESQSMVFKKILEMFDSLSYRDIGKNEVKIRGFYA